MYRDEVIYLSDPYMVYKVYSALKAHLSGYFLIRRGLQDCYYFKLPKTSFYKRKDITLFQRFASEYTLQEAYDFFLSQFVENTELYTFTITKEIFIAKEVYSEWKKRMKNIRENYVNDCTFLLNKYGSWRNIIKDRGKDYPVIFMCMLQRLITFETFSWLAYFFKMDTPGLYKNLVEPSSYETLVKKYLRYRLLTNLTSKEVKELTPRKKGDIVSL